MRRMFSEGQIKSIVNSGIESGEISTPFYKVRIKVDNLAQTSQVLSQTNYYFVNTTNKLPITKEDYYDIIQGSIEFNGDDAEVYSAMLLDEQFNPVKPYKHIIIYANNYSTQELDDLWNANKFSYEIIG